MENVIIVIILIAVLIPAILSSIKHMKGEGDCCGGPKEKPKKKKIAGKPISTVTLKIEGMHCNNCRVRLENRLNEFDGVVAKVDLAKKQAILKLYQDVDLEEIKQAVAKLDFKVVE